jgi:mRNA interferase HicA
MRRKDLVWQIEAQGCYLLRHGSRHDVYITPKNGMKQPVPRHKEIDDPLSDILRSI